MSRAHEGRGEQGRKGGLAWGTQDVWEQMDELWRCWSCCVRCGPGVLAASLWAREGHKESLLEFQAGGLRAGGGARLGMAALPHSSFGMLGKV